MENAWALVAMLACGALFANTYQIDLVSGEWRSESEVDKPLWQHMLTVTVPEEIETEEILLQIAGSRGASPLPIRGSIWATLDNVPNQPLLFADAPCSRSEDAIIAYGWDKFLRTGDPDWVPQLPMTRAVVRAMDALEKFCQEELGRNVSGFVLTGRSKRGWTAWRAAGLDPRVKGVIPLVIDLLNMKVCFEHHYRAYGSWSPALRDYVEIKIPERWNEPRFDELISIVDPYELRERLATIPKYIINSTGDAYFLPDSSQFYFHELGGEKYLRYVPNSDHCLQGSNVTESVAAFYWALSRNKPLPKISWRLEENRLHVNCDPPPRTARLWRATNPVARDFRLCTIGRAWRCEPLRGRREFEAHLAPPLQGWSAFVVELIFESGGPFPYTFTTDVYVLPNVLPFDVPKVLR